MKESQYYLKIVEWLVHGESLVCLPLKIIRKICVIHHIYPRNSSNGSSKSSAIFMSPLALPN
jgi:hypothetical protein